MRYLLTLLFTVSLTTTAHACPFCATPMQTLSEELAEAEAAVIARLEKPMADFNDAELPTEEEPEEPVDDTALFVVVEPLRGNSAQPGDELKIVYFGEDPPEKRFMISSFSLNLGEEKPVTGERVEWGTPLPLSDAAVEYVKQLETIPEKGPDRLEFFQKYFEHPDPLLAQDAYDEFARAPYEVIIAFKDRMQRDKLIEWIESPEVGPSSRRLYLTMLGVCGQSDDVAMLEKLLNFDYDQIKPLVAASISTLGLTGAPAGTGIVDTLVRAEDRRKKECLDALIACYLKLKGPDGLELVKQRFFANPNVRYYHLHSAIMAMRFHGEETDIIPREDLLKTMRLVLDHPKFADQVVTDLTRWEDWEIMNRLVSLFLTSEEDAYIRLPVASYLLVAAEQPGDVGKQANSFVTALRSIDPDTMKRAELPLAFSALSMAKSRPVDEQEETQATGPADSEETNTEAAKSVEKAASMQKVPAVSSDPDTAKPQPTEDKQTPSVEAPSRIAMIGTAILAGVIMFVVFGVLIRGSDPRSTRPENQT